LRAEAAILDPETMYQKDDDGAVPCWTGWTGWTGQLQSSCKEKVSPFHMVSHGFTVHERLFGGDSKDVEMFLIEPG